MSRIVKREPVNVGGGSSSCRSTGRARTEIEEREETGDAGIRSSGVGVANRRTLRSKYLNIKNRIHDEEEDISRVDSDKFKYFIDEVESLHENVQTPREQVADAEALWGITSTLLTSVKSHTNGGVTPSDFVSCLIRDFAYQFGPSTSSNGSGSSLRWEDIGFSVCHVFKRAPGCCTMLGPMNTELKQRKAVVRRKRHRLDEGDRPEELNNDAEERSDTDKNMATMFNVLRKNRMVRLENLILNRNCFAQTVENLFGLSFLVKDGRAEITVDEKGCHLVSPRNAPAANAVASGEVSYCHFVFRFDFRDWKLMMASVVDGEELMPQRSQVNLQNNTEPEPASNESQAAVPTTPIRKLSRNRGLVLQEQTIVHDHPDGENLSNRAAAIRRGKRKLNSDIEQ